MSTGDFRQVLPVVPRGTKADEINSCLKSSDLWKHIKCLHLQTNMRIKLNSSNISAKQYADWLLHIGNGTLPTNTEGHIKFEQINNIVCDLNQLITQIYPNITEITSKPIDWWSERAILAPKNETVDNINNTLINNIVSQPVTYLAIDNTCDPQETVNYPIEFLNSLTPTGLPPYRLILKIGMPIILLRNLNAPKLCNGTRMLVRNLKSNFIEAQIITGSAKGEYVCIPRIPMKPSDYPFEFKRIQFPVKPCFAITINKAQGQTLTLVGLDLREPCFTHGQLYVGLSRISNPEGLYILLPFSKTTPNIVYSEIL